MNLHTKIPPAYLPDGTVVVVCSKEEEGTVLTWVDTDDVLDLVFGDKALGRFVFKSQSHTTLGEVNYRDLIGLVYTTPSALWLRLEQAEQRELHSETPVIFVELVSESALEDLLNTEEDSFDEETVELIGRRRRKLNWEDE